MKDPAESKLQKTRQRSAASIRHKFDFIGNSEPAVFPILKRDKKGIIILVGTGFFIAPGGIFASAKHVFQGQDVHPDDTFEIIQASNDHVEPRLINELVFDDNQDIAVGHLESPHEQCVSCTDHPVVGIMKLDPEINEVMGSFVFPHTLVDEPKTHQINDSLKFAQQVKFRSHWEIGLVEEIFLNGRGFVKGRCFSTSIFIEGRSSGGPVFNSNGFVVGLNSSPSSQDRTILKSYSWPGNVRELKNLLERAVILCRKTPLNFSEILNELMISVESEFPQFTESEKIVVTKETDLQGLNRENILKALSATNWKISGDRSAAKLLGVKENTLWKRINKLGLKKPN